MNTPTRVTHRVLDRKIGKKRGIRSLSDPAEYSFDPVENDKVFHFDFPTVPIGGGNPYHKCASCGLSVPAINGDLDKHRPDCSWANAKRTEPFNGRIWEVDCSAYGPASGPSIVGILAKNRVFRVGPSEKEGMFEITEMCDYYFSATLTAEQLEALGRELIAIAKGQKP